MKSDLKINPSPDEYGEFETDFSLKRKEVLQLIRTFVFVRRDQVVSYLNNDTQLAGKILASLVKTRKIKVWKESETGVPIEYCSELDLLEKSQEKKNYQIALWYLLKLRKKKNIGAYCVGSNNFLTLCYEYKNDIFDVIVMPIGAETNTQVVLHMKERYLSKEERDDLHRIIILYDESQLEELEKLNYDFLGLEEIYIITFDGGMKRVVLE